MAEDAAGAAVQVLVQNLLSMFSQEIKLVRGFGDDLTHLKDSLDMIRRFLSDAEEKEITNKSVQKWLLQLQDLAFEAYAILDDINYYSIRQKIKNPSQESKKIWYCFSSDSPSLRFRREMALKIKDVIKNLEMINKSAVSFGLQEAVVNANDVNYNDFTIETDPFKIEPYFVGRENDIVEVVDMLVANPSDETCSVVPIVGMGGLGKTTLARKVYNHERIVAHFEIKIWVCVSVGVDAVRLLKMILQALTEENVQVSVTKVVVLEKIRKHLAGKRYLLVLDDVWNEDAGMWEDFMNSLSGVSSTKGNGIVFTTRNENIASVVEADSTHRLSELSKDECWSIIKAKALGKVDVSTEHEEIGNRIAQRCGGLPLAANVVGGLLRGKPKDEWSSILENQLSNFGQDENPVTKILRLSYDRLPSSSLKRCFAYCSVFPEDSEMEKDMLVKLWMAEGFLQANQDKHMENVGNGFFNYLLQASLIQVSKRDYFGSVTHCRMHDLVHDLAYSVCGSGSTGVRDSGNDVSKVRYLYLKSDEPYYIFKERAKYLRTFIFGGKVEDNFFSPFSYLHILVLEDAFIRNLPTEIGNQKHLRLLNISETSIIELPNSVRKLSNLQTLMVPKELKKLPSTIIELLSLRHLHISSIELPPWIGKLTSLRTLPYYRVGFDNGCKIKELRNLENLTGKLEVQNLERVNDEVEAKQADLFGKRGIFVLVLKWNEPRQGEINDENVLEGLQPHPNLKSLEIRGYASRDFPSWTKKMEVYNNIEHRWEGFTNLVKVKLHRCKCQEIPNLGHLPCLKFLEIEDLHNVQHIGLSFYGLEGSGNSAIADNVNIQEKRTAFPALEELTLRELQNLTEWMDVESRVAAFPCLEDLTIIGCPQLKSVPGHFPCLKSLYIFDTVIDFSSTNKFSSTTSLRKLNIYHSPGLVHLPDGFFVKNQDLSYLKVFNCHNLMSLVPNLIGVGSSLQKFLIFDCKNLKELPEDLNSTLQSLKELHISNCPELKSIPYVGFMSLRELRITHCHGLKNLQCELLESCNSSLESLILYELDNVENLIPGISRMSCLENLVLLNLPKLLNFPTENVSCLKNLRRLKIGCFSDSLSVVLFNDYLKCILHEHHSLHELTLYGNKDWGCLPDHIQHLTDLAKLELQDFGFEALPEWLGNLSSLQELHVCNCKRLNHMPSKEAMGCLTRLDLLRIENCPVMAERCRQHQSRTTGNDDSEWPKISHIKMVKLDRQQLPTRNSPIQEQKFACCFPIPRSSH